MKIAKIEKIETQEGEIHEKIHNNVLISIYMLSLQFIIR